MRSPNGPILATAAIGLLAAGLVGSAARAGDDPIVERFQSATWTEGDGLTRAIVVVDRVWSSDEAAAFADSVGGRLASAPSAPILAFLASLCDLEGAFDCDGPWLSGARPAFGGWSWADGSAFDGFGFAPGRPAQAAAVRAALQLSGSSSPEGIGAADGTWIDALPSPDAGTTSRSAVLEWTTFADCDADGRPDLLEIAADPTLDADGDGALDACVGNPADLDGDGMVAAADLAILLDAWGDQGAPGTIPADLSGDGVVNAADLSALLAAWGAGA